MAPQKRRERWFFEGIAGTARQHNSFFAALRRFRREASGSLLAMVRKLLILALLSTISCKEKAPTKEDKPTSPATEPTVQNVAVKPTPVPTPARPDLALADVEDLVDRWLTAQNEGDFGAYSATYAKRITGIKRAGNRETTYNREDWLADRKRMFRKPMKVESAKQSIHTSPTSAVVRFEQTWASGKFKDVGPKQLIVVREAGALRIAREEMQASTVIRSRHGLPVELSELYFGAKGIEGFVLSAADIDWARGPITVAGSDPYIATRAANLESLPEPWKSLVGKKITLYSSGAACQNTVASLQIVVGVTPHFMFFQDENGEQMDLDEAAFAEDIFEMGTPYLVARTVGSCTGPIAHLGAVARPASPVEQTTDEAVASRVRKAFQASAEFQAHQKEYESYSDFTPGPWSSETVTLFRVQDETIAFVAAEAGDGCGDFEGALTHIYRVGNAGAPKLVGSLPTFFEAIEAIDIGNDGLVEFVGETHNYGTGEVTFVGTPNRDADYSVVHRFGWDYHDCPC